MQKHTHFTFRGVALIVFLYLVTGLVIFFCLTRVFHSTGENTSLRWVIVILLFPVLTKYLLHLCIAPWYSVVEYIRSRRRPKYLLPLVSVLIPAWNEEIGILSTIQSVINTNYPRLEIVVINDGSTDRTHEVVTKFFSDYKEANPRLALILTYRYVPNGGKARALNTALSIAQAEIVVTIDADSVMHRDTIENMVKHFMDPQIAAVAGNVLIGNRTKPIGIVQQLEYMYGFYFKRAESLLNAVYIVGGAAAAYNKKIVLELGGYDEESLTEDIELSTRLQAAGHRVRLAADAVVYTEGPSDVRGLFQQRYRWKYGRLTTFYKYRSLFFNNQAHLNLYLTYFILPIAVFAEILLLLEGVLILIYYLYTFSTNDFSPLVFFILLLMAIITFQVLTDSNVRHHRRLLFIAPVAWLLFYFMEVVEFQALIRSFRSILQKRKPQWQSWVRSGVFESQPETATAPTLMVGSHEVGLS